MFYLTANGTSLTAKKEGMKLLKRVVKLIGNIFTVIVILIFVLSVYSLIQYRKNPDKPPAVFGFNTMSVLSGSMRPYLEPGDIIVGRSVKLPDVKPGDVVTYKVGSSIVTHRVVEIVGNGSNRMLMTKGDANNTDDGKPIAEDQLISRVVFRVPYGGYIARFIRSPIGLIILAGILIALMFAGESKKAILPEGKGKCKSEPEPGSSVHID